MTVLGICSIISSAGFVTFIFKELAPPLLFLKFIVATIFITSQKITTITSQSITNNHFRSQYKSKTNPIISLLIAGLQLFYWYHTKSVPISIAFAFIFYAYTIRAVIFYSNFRH